MKPTLKLHRLCILLLVVLGSVISGPITTRGSGKPMSSPLPALQGIRVKSPKDNMLSNVCNLIESKHSNLVLVFLTHLGDLGSWELSQKIQYYAPLMKQQRINLIAIAPGTVSNGVAFCEQNKFPIDSLFIDEDAACYSALEFSKGAFPSAPVSPYVKLLPMLMGIESKGTIPEVLRGYFGDKNERSDWIKQSLRIVNDDKFDVIGENYQRPFELATLRLQNMMDVLNGWNTLIPPNQDLITQQGGLYAFKNKQVVYEFKDTGILAYGNMEKALSNLGVSI